MSLVSVVLKENHITIMSDGRVTDDQMKSVDENYQKFKIISPKQFIGFAGNKEYCELIVSQIKYSEVMYNLSVISEEILEFSIENAGEAKWNFVLGGIDIDGMISAYYLNRASSKVNLFKPQGEDINYLYLHNTKEVSDKKVEEVFRKSLNKRKNNSVFEFYNAQKEFNDFIASYDPSVNKIKFKHRIRK